ncbi:PREDICTED: uncharacterized protein LOC101301388 [Fragaria vesca subsp. vesca]
MNKHNREEVLQKAEKDLVAVADQFMVWLIKELQGTDFWMLRQAYSPGIQERVEAATFSCKFNWRDDAGGNCAGEVDVAEKTCKFVLEIYRELTPVCPLYG